MDAAELSAERARRLVESIWLFDGMLSRRERYYPTGELDLIIHLDPSESFRIVEGQPASASPSSCLAGLIVVPLVIEVPAARSRMVGVRLRPAGAFALFGVPLHELTGTAVDLHDVAAMTDRSGSARSSACPPLHDRQHPSPRRRACPTSPTPIWPPGKPCATKPCAAKPKARRDVAEPCS